uniref:hypothetical protein n=1 Tax=Pedobacter sp. TaxID=1411316 RepID=UPI00159A32F1|nr:hypothetical protein [Pedobacter sp.]QJS06263.1 hypothetical protein [Pedobacter sp.]
MSFWKTSRYSYHSFADLPKKEVNKLIEELTREDLIEWLSWNDPNGIYDDDQSLRELNNIMSREEGIEIMLRHINESKINKL